MSTEGKFALLAATRHIGWGAIGKLRLILEKLPDADVTLHGDEHAVTLTREFLGSNQKFASSPPPKFDVALVINDPGVANEIAGRGPPVVYVDSLPHVHKTDTDVPDLAKVAFYCAQKYPIDLFPLTSPLLRKWHDIRWIEPIVPAPQSRRGGHGAVINVGGLYAYNVAGLPDELINSAVDAYLNVVLFQLVEILQAMGRKISAICGNLKADTCRRLRAMVPDDVAVGPQSPRAFERVLSDADLLITSPGSTTILQATSIGLPTLLMPSQNRSQFFNAQVYSRPNSDIMQWPASVLDVAKLQELRSQGLKALNTYIYLSIIDASNTPAKSDEIKGLIRRVLSNAPQDGVLNPQLSALGFAGADQVAQLVKRVGLRERQAGLDDAAG
jgi:hydroxymethylcytosylglucuronate/cytosylglucuronate synthase